jgi:hypothetical protein
MGDDGSSGIPTRTPVGEAFSDEPGAPDQQTFAATVVERTEGPGFHRGGMLEVLPASVVAAVIWAHGAMPNSPTLRLGQNPHALSDGTGPPPAMAIRLTGSPSCSRWDMIMRGARLSASDAGLLRKVLEPLDDVWDLTTGCSGSPVLDPIRSGPNFLQEGLS